MAQCAATGISDRPITVITQPLTSGGKKRVTLENTGATSRPSTAEAITAPRMPGSPPPVCKMLTMVATPANDTPCTSGRRLPKNGMPRVCNNVATPPMNRQAVISRPASAADMPAASATISGTATMPPYMVSTCCRP